MTKEFEKFKEFYTGIGVDIGCGTNRLSPDILAIDNQADKRYAHCEIVHNCHDLEIKSFEWRGNVYTFKDSSLDFIFSSHCLEDFADIPTVFKNWWKKIKTDSLMILLLPDMEGGRYPKVGEAHGNPSHKTNVGKKYITEMLNNLDIKYEMIKSDTLPHNETCSIDFVIKKLQ